MTYEEAREKIAESIAGTSTSLDEPSDVWKDYYYKKADSILSQLLSPSQIAAWKAGGELTVKPKVEMKPVSMDGFKYGKTRDGRIIK